MTPQEQRIERMRKAGLPMPITQINEGAINAIPVTAANADKHARLAALKSGANKQVVRELVTSKGSQSAQAFQGIPEPVRKKAPQGHPSNQITPGKSVQVASFEAKKDDGLSALESLYGGGSDMSYSQPIMANNMSAPMTTQPELSIPSEGVGPVFDPMGMLAKKRAAQNSVQAPQAAQKGVDYMKFAMNPTQAQQAPAVDQQQFDFNYMQKMMHEIAKNTISEVLNSYTEKNKEKLTYEHYTTTKEGAQVIKTQDGKYYKLVPVKLKNS